MNLDIIMDVHIALGLSARIRTKAQNSKTIDDVYRRLAFADSEIHLESAPKNHPLYPYDFIYKGLIEEHARILSHEISNQIEDIYAKPVKVRK